MSLQVRVEDFGHVEGQSAQSPPSASPAPSMFGPNTTFGNTQETEFIHGSRDVHYNKTVFNISTGSQKRGESDDNLAVPDVIDTLKSALEKMLTTGIGDSSARPQVISEPDAVVDDIVPDPSSLAAPISIADKYSRAMLKCLAGYPLYKPYPYNNSVSATNHLREGIRVGDVGFIRENGAFDFLFNICPSQRDSFNPPGLPINFTLRGSEKAEIDKEEQFSHKTRLFHPPVYRKKVLLYTRYKCSESEGAILELPEGATRMEVINRLPFKELAVRYGVEWYRYTMSQGRDITNGSLYLVTSSTKCSHWGIAVVQRPSPPWGGLRFVHTNGFFRDRIRKYHWEARGSSTFTTTSAPDLDPDHGAAPNQCVFLRGFKIKLREDIWNGLINEHREKSHQAMSSPYVDLKPASVHPSDIINTALLTQEPRAKIAITHDDEWCDFVREISKSSEPLDFAKIAQLYTSSIDKNGSISFEKSQRNSTLDGVNIHALAKLTRKTLRRLAPIAQSRPIGPVQDTASVNKIHVKIKNLIDGIDSSMLATQSALKLANEALRLEEATKSPDQESSIVSGRAIEGLASIATLGERHAQKSATIFKDVAQDLDEIAATTKEKRDVMVILTPDPEQREYTIGSDIKSPFAIADQTTKKSLRDVGLDLHANLDLFIDFAQQVSALANWLALVRQEIVEFASAAASHNTGAITLPPMLNVGVWTKVQVDYHSYFRTIRRVQSHYRNLVSASFETWQLSAKSISLSGDGSVSDRSASPSPLAPTTVAPPSPNPNQTSPTNNSKLVKKVRSFLSTSLSPRPEVKGLFPTSVKSDKRLSLSINRSSASGPSEQKKKGKEREKRE